TVTEVACTSLEILKTTAGSVCGEGYVILEAQGAAPAVNTEIYWYNAATGGDVVGMGSPFQTPALEQTTSFWAAEVALSGGGFSDGYGLPAPISGQNFGTAANYYGLLFDVHQAFTLYSVDVYTGSATGDNIEIL